MELFAKPRNKPQFQRRTKVKFYFDAKAENVRANRIQVQTTPELCAVTAALAPLRIQKGLVGIERTLPCPEDIRTVAATDLANEFTAVSCSTDDLLEWHCVSDKRHDGGIRLLAPEIPFILQPFRASQQFRIDRRRTDCGADRPHGAAYGIEEGGARVLH